MPDHRPPHSTLDSIDQLFLRQARQTPDAVALVSGKQRLTYQQLLDRAESVAGRLASLGVGHETLVAMAFPRGADAVVAMLGIILAKGAYLPVNPDFPTGRITQLLDDARPSVLLCGDGLSDPLTDAVPAGTALYELKQLDQVERQPVRAVSSASSLAYVMYTSGSTGRPKGVMVEHAGVIRLVQDADYFDFSPRHRFLQTGALEFDAATFEIWGALLNGAVLHVVDRDVLLTPARLKQAVQATGVTVLWLTSPLFNQLADEDATLFAGVETLLVGGDVLSVRHINLVRAACPGLRILNAYGPTENTTFTTVFPVDRDYRTAIPIGRAVSGTSVHVIGPDGRPAAPGQVGELYTGGLGLARGYLGRPDLTAERFVELAGERCYRTGDLVSADTDGVLSFHGRADDQVKIRGHRVEVKEVTAVLLEVSGVRDAHTVVTGEGNGRRLLSYAVAEEGIDADAVRDALRLALPTYMCPDQVVLVQALPLNANGKVDIARLPAPPARAARGPVPARTPMEDVLAGLWADVLHLDAAGIAPADDFFELGGTSLTAGALVGRIHRATGAALSLQQLFAARTLSATAAEVSAAERSELLPVPVVPGRTEAVLHPQQRALYALWQTDPDSTAYNIPFRLDIAPGLDAGRLRDALGALVRRHDALRTGFRMDSEEVRQVVAPFAGFELETASGPEVPSDSVATERFVRPFDLAAPPLLRALLVKDDDADRLYLDVHHIVFDGVSLAVLVEELLDLYAGIEPVPSGAGYGDASEWFAGQLGSLAMAESGRYWRETFTEVPAPLALTTDHPRPSVRGTRGDVLRLELGAARSHAVRESAARHAVTGFTVLLCAYATALSRITGQRDLVIGSPMSGRTHPDVDRMVGMFVNTVALRLRLGDSDTFRDVLRRTGESHGPALTHQNYPFEQLVQAVVPRRDPSRNALFDAFFALQNIGFHSFRRHGRHVEVALLHQGTCRFDLNLQAYERPEGTVLEFEYNTELFTASSARFLLDRIVAALDELTADPDAPAFWPGPAAERPAAERPATPVSTAAHFSF
ncbi:amino acid adenylation domain-containing protein [Streptomyces sp. B-S-A8]|uniref:Amino acid adenylation domain-containing protein n=1 Tax=Streptomyces solicavernae TaxID=3043614 RepID=A0ABT6S1X2_9ACTN|nr:amino acid adenylation domain-containing protein [Streptomyces sp. B-S-A8]MDI3390679.1 amino acid adenylation domain-containing protein [Streptomyces sp. B-S-A8]